MGTQLLEQILVDKDAGLVRLTVEQYHRMTETGILEEGSPIELLDGLLVLKDRRDCKKDFPMNVGTRHAVIVTRLYNAIQKAVETELVHVLCQQPIALPPQHQPEPDVSLITGLLEDYLHHHPGPTEIITVMEVAESSLQHDRDVKQRVYADAGIREYWIVDLSANQIDVYTQPQANAGQYVQVQNYFPGDDISLELPSGRIILVAVNDILMIHQP